MLQMEHNLSVFQTCLQVNKLRNTPFFFHFHGAKTWSCILAGYCAMKTLVWIFSVYNYLSGFSGEHGEVMQLFQHLMKAFLDELQQRCGSTENIPLLFLFGLDFASGSQHIHPIHCLLYFTLMSC